VTSTPVPSIAGKVASFDNVQINQGTHRLYVADRTDQGVDVFDISAARAKYVGTVPLSSPPNGMALAPALARLFVGTANGTVVVVDTKNSSETVIAEVKTGTSADLLDYGAARNRVYVSNGADGTITSIDPSTNTVKAVFSVGYLLEQPRFDPVDGMVYVSSPTADALFQIDPNDGLVKNRLPLSGCTPYGMAINPSTNTALMACKAFVMSRDLRTGAVEKFSQVRGADVVNYDAAVDRFFVGSAQKTGPSVVIYAGSPITYTASVTTGADGNSAAYDETHGLVYTPDTRANQSGVASFVLPAAPPRWLSTLTTFGPYVALVAAFLLLFIFIARSADPARRPPPKALPAVEPPELSPRRRKGQTT